MTDPHATVFDVADLGPDAPPPAPLPASRAQRIVFWIGSVGLLSAAAIDGIRGSSPQAARRRICCRPAAMNIATSITRSSLMVRPDILDRQHTEAKGGAQRP